MKVLLVAVALALFLTFALPTQAQTHAALSILKFTAPKGTLSAGSPVTVTGTSMQPNATKTNCNVQFQTNQAGYLPVTPQGPPTGKYENWTATSAPLQHGLNILEAQLQCFAPGHLNGPPNLLKHLVHNVTALSSASASAPSASPSTVPTLPPK